jgi:hypothetical protein
LKYPSTRVKWGFSHQKGQTMSKETPAVKETRLTVAAEWYAERGPVVQKILAGAAAGACAAVGLLAGLLIG